MVKDGYLKSVMVRPTGQNKDILVYACTGRGIAHLVADCKVPLPTLFKTWPRATAALQKEAMMKRGNLKDDAELQAVYEITFGKYIAYEYFDQNSDLLMPKNMIEANKLGLQILSAICDDERISTESITKMIGFPGPMAKMFGEDRKSIKRAIETQLEMY